MRAAVLHHKGSILLGAAFFAALALLLAVRQAPLEPLPFVRVDGLSAVFLLATLVSLALDLAVQPSWRRLGRLAPGLLVLVAAFATPSIPAIIGCYIALAALLTLSGAALPPLQAPRFGALPAAAAALLGRAPLVLAAASLLAAYGALVRRGALAYDERLAGAALDSFVFWFALLAAAIPLALGGRRSGDGGRETRDGRRETRDERQGEEERRRGGEEEEVEFKTDSSTFSLQPSAFSLQPSAFSLQPSAFSLQPLSFAWLYPLARLYSLGPWNAGWSLATLLLGGAVALWAAGAAFTEPSAPERRTLAARSVAALALAGFGLSTSAGVTAGCYALLASLIISTPINSPVSAQPSSFSLFPSSFTLHPWSFAWLLSGAIPFTAPFMAAWMVVGAAAAGGVTALAGAAWLAILLNGLTVALHGGEPRTPDLAVRGAVSLTVGLAAPPLAWLIGPASAQLQGGLTPYGDVNIWPWLGMAAVSSANAQVTSYPAIAVAALMIVLVALVYLAARLRSSVEIAPTQTAVAQSPAAVALELLRAEVPWLARRRDLASESERPRDPR